MYKRQVQQSDAEKALELLSSSDVAPDVAQVFLHDTQNSTYSGNLSIMRMNGPEVVDGKDMAILSGETLDWVVTPQVGDETMFECQSFTTHSFGLLLFDAFMELTKPEAA